MKVTIHQPDMLPWLGFFNKINKADLWVILDHTSNNPRDSAFWGRRVKMLINGEEKWIALPLVKPDSGIVGIPINEMKFNMSNPKVYVDTLKTIEQGYKKAPYFADIFPFLDFFFRSEEPLMATRNLNFIFLMMEKLSITTPIIRSSELNCVESSTDLLVEIVKKTNADTYLCGGGASGYQNDEIFAENGIQLEYNNFKHPLYAQKKIGPFTPGLSIIDALMNIGISATKSII